MPIIEVDQHKLGQLTSLKHTALDEIAIGADSVSNSFVRRGFSRENRELTRIGVDPHVIVHP